MQGLVVKIVSSSHTNPAFQTGVYTSITTRVRISLQNQSRRKQDGARRTPKATAVTFVEALLPTLFFLDRFAIGGSGLRSGVARKETGQKEGQRRQTGRANPNPIHGATVAFSKPEEREKVSTRQEL